MNKINALVFVALIILFGFTMLIFQAGRLHAKAEIMYRYDKSIETESDLDVQKKCYIFEGDNEHKNCYYH